MRKELFESYFKDKKVTVLGLGLLGRGVGDTVFLARHGATLTVTDKKTKEELKPSLEQLETFPAIEYSLGEHALKDFEDKDFILKAAGVPLESEFVEHAKKQNIPIYMSAALVVKIIRENLKEVKVVGVTGTRGKSTATNLIHHILLHASRRAHLGGNVRGVANLPLLEAIEEGDCLVLELDSWQLQGFNDLKISPDIALFTSFLDDHLNYYKGDKELYFADKAAIYRNQNPGDVLIASSQAAEEIRKRDPEVNMRVPEVRTYHSLLIGEHNEALISLAHEACKQLGLDEEAILAGIATFKPVDGRLEYMGEHRGVHVYNDNNATTPDATVVGIEAVMQKYNKKPILICGGSDKGLSLDALEESIANKTKQTIFLSGTGTDTLHLERVNEFETLEECVQKAYEVSEAGDVILFSPGFASFSNHFNNEYERNDAFVKIIQNLQ